jgi:hypothetical protein
MAIFGWLVMSLLVLLNLWTIGALVLGYRRAERPAVRRLARLTTLLIGLVTLVVLGATALSVAADVGSVGEPSQRATLLAAAISESMNCLALLFLGLILPVTGAIVLAVRWRRLPGG